MTEGSPFRAPMTFMGVPYAASPGNAKAVVLGVPFDCGNHPQRVGSRLGPFAIREQSQLLRPWDADSGVNPLETLGLLDLGDADVVSGDVTSSYATTERAMDVALSGGALPVAFGGDGAIALPQMRALARRHPDLAVLHIDAHTDAYPIEGFNNATPFARAFQEGLVDPRQSFHVGTRRSTMVPGVYEYGRQLGYGIISMDQLMQDGIAQTLGRIRETIGGRPVYLCFDMDFFDPSVAPGVCTPAWGGASAREGLELIRCLKGLNIVSIDINTISPPHDTGGMSAFLAATIAFELLLMAAKGDFHG
ncbi:arginase family protein [Roseovarius sp. ZX-A-9]|uniref:arginase family protein n=1 Tax=Roseovarius sp. ZX-A-9 TaxID=3014783 RepID=UPI00232FCDCC|nr:arginase family protein [Roseovarius sp. ZX-A-9]